MPRRYRKTSPQAEPQGGIEPPTCAYLDPPAAVYQGAEMTKLARFKSTPFTGPGYYEAPYAEGPTSFQVPHLAGANPQSTIETVMKRVIRCSPQF